MNTGEPAPISPDAQVPLADLFSDMLGLADQVAARIPQHEVEARLHRALQRARNHDPAGASGSTLGGLGTPAAADARRALLPLPGQDATTWNGHPANRRLRDAEPLLAAARQEAASLRAEARAFLTMARNGQADADRARAAAAQARAEAQHTLAKALRIIEQARSYDDDALTRAAAILRDANAQAEHARNQAESLLATATAIMEQARSYQGACLTRAATILRDARAEAGDIAAKTQQVMERARSHDTAGVTRFARRGLPPRTSIPGASHAAPGVIRRREDLPGAADEMARRLLVRLS
jgi:hypothetical protein